jgi:hypothetical protein
MKHNIMARQSISFTKPNGMAAIGAMIRQARKQQVQVDFIRAFLKSESSGFTSVPDIDVTKQRKIFGQTDQG